MKIQGVPTEFSPSAWRQLIGFLTSAFNSLRLGENLDGQIVENVIIPGGEVRKIAHNLKTVPLYRIILRQRGDSAVRDSHLAGDEWTDTYITLYNTGVGPVTLTVLIMRG